jgi:hypothetical protein
MKTQKRILPVTPGQPTVYANKFQAVQPVKPPLAQRYKKRIKPVKPDLKRESSESTD